MRHVTEAETFKHVPPGGPRLGSPQIPRCHGMAWHGMAAAKGLIDADGLQAQLRCLDGTCRELAWRSKTLRILRISTDWIPTTEGTDAIQDRFRTNW